MLLTELVYCVTVTFTMTERVDQLKHDNAPAHSTDLVQAFLFWQSIISPRSLSPPYRPDLGPCGFCFFFSKAKIAVERQEFCECEGHTVRKLSQWRLTADWLAHRTMTVHGCTVRSPLIGWQVTSRSLSRFSRYTKWLDTLRTAFVIKKTGNVA